MPAIHWAGYPLLGQHGPGPVIRQLLGNFPLILQSNLLEKTMWSKPEYTEMRFGFEVTMYIANR